MEPQVKIQTGEFCAFRKWKYINDIFKELSDAMYHVERNGNAKIITDLSITTRLIHKKKHEQHYFYFNFNFLAITFLQSGYDKLFYWKEMWTG
jgi:hypothetical protein